MTALRLTLAIIASTVVPLTSYGQTADVIREVVGWDPVGEFNWALESRTDSATARPRFARAAEMFDSAWVRGPYRRTPQLALNRGRAHLLADELPQAIRAFRDGLDLAPWDAELQAGLAHCRAKVAYPTEAVPAEHVRPDPVASLRNRISPIDLLAITALFSLLLTIGLARRFTTDDGWFTFLNVIGAVGLLAVAAAGIVIDQQNQSERDRPVVVVMADTVLRSGNGPSFPARTDAPLPRGAEVRELGRRGGWVQVELAGGAVGWLPEASVLGGSPSAVRITP